MSGRPDIRIGFAPATARVDSHALMRWHARFERTSQWSQTLDGENQVPFPAVRSQIAHDLEGAGCHLRSATVLGTRCTLAQGEVRTGRPRIVPGIDDRHLSEHRPVEEADESEAAQVEMPDERVAPLRTREHLVHTSGLLLSIRIATKVP